MLDSLRSHGSPEQIAGKLPLMNTAVVEAGQALPDGATTVSHETIYCGVHDFPSGKMRSEWLGLLRQRRKKRLPRARGSTRRRASCAT